MSFRQLRTAVIGVGNMGGNHARVLHELPGSKLIAICDTNHRVGKDIARRFNCAFYDNYSTMLAHQKIDAVCVAVPTKLHKSIGLDVIRAGKHVLIEKPIAATVAEAKLLIKAANKHNVILTVGHIERFNPAVRHLKYLIQKKKFGDITSIIAKRVGPSASQIKDSGVLIDLAVHDIDVVQYLLERTPTKISVNGGWALQNPHEDYADIFLNFGGISAYIQVNWLTPVGIRALNITGTDGYAELNYITQKIVFYQTKYKKITPPRTFKEVILNFESVKKTVPHIPFQEPLKIELQSFLRSIRYRRKPEVCPQDALQALAIALKALKAIHYA